MSTKHLMGALIALVLFLLVLSAWGVIQTRLLEGGTMPESAAPSPLDLETTASGEIIAPEITKTMQQVLEESTGFQALVSYTERGFEPQALSIKQGDTVRFTNNSVRDLWVATVGSPHPPTGENCGASAFDSCVALKPLEFWEFTFAEEGEWQYVDNLHKEFSGTVQVQ